MKICHTTQVSDVHHTGSRRFGAVLCRLERRGAEMRFEWNFMQHVGLPGHPSGVTRGLCLRRRRSPGQSAGSHAWVRYRDMYAIILDAENLDCVAKSRLRCDYCLREH